MTGEELPTTPGSVVRTADDARRWGLAHEVGCLLRWRPLTHHERRPPRRPDELAADEPDLVVVYTAPPWTEPERK